MSEYVYFAQAYGGGPIKIGRSGDPKRRVLALNTASPEKLDLIAVLPADERVENRLHHVFRASRLHGEWFAEDAPVLDELIEAIIDPGWAERNLPELGAALARVREHFTRELRDEASA